ncbi:MAG: phage tail tape measure protein [Bacillaceae bacterium]|nr:phage tail tape measure protein [Bacillaceae bacterium]
MNEVLKVVISAQDQATRSIQNITKSLGDLRGAAVYAGAALGALVLKESISAFTDFQSVLKQSVAIMGDVTKEMEQTLAKKALEISNEMAVSQEEVGKAYYYLASAGLEYKEVLEGVTDVAKLAVAAHIDMAEAANIAVGVMKGFGYTSQDLTRINDMLIATVTKSNTNLEQLGEALKYVAPFAHQVGWELSEVNAALGVLADRNIKGATAGVYLRQAIAQLIDPTAQARDTLARLGLTAEDVNPEMHSLTEIIQTLNDAGATTSDVIQLLGVRAGGAFAILLQEGAPALREFNQELLNSAGITEQVRSKQEEAFGEQLKILKNNLTSIAITIGSQVVPALNAMLQPILKLLQAFNSLPEPIQKTTGALIALGSSVMVIAGVIKAISALAGLLGMGGALATAAGALSGVASTIGAALAAIAGAVSLPILAIGALIAAVVALVFNIGGARDKLIAALTTVKDSWVWLFGVIKTKVTEFSSAVATKAKELGGAIIANLKEGLSGIKAAVVERLNAVRTALMELPGRVKTAAISVGRAIIDGIKQGLANLWGTLKEALFGPIQRAVEWIKDKLQIGSPSKVFARIGESIVQGYQQGLDTARKIKPVLPAPQFAFAPTTPSTTGTNITVNIKLEGVAIREESDIDSLAEEIERRIGRRLGW